MKKKEKIYYGGFINNEISYWASKDGLRFASVFENESQAKCYYSDVRPVRIVEVKK